MDLLQALKVGILPAKASPVEILLISQKEGLTELFQSQVVTHNSIFTEETDHSLVRKKFMVICDFSQKELTEMSDLKSWEQENYDKSKSILNKLRPRKIYRPVDDTTVLNCHKCNLVFDIWNRKHHCRACGEIFCYSCSQWNEHIPSDLIRYTNQAKWITPGTPSRVCQHCRESISKYRKIEEIIKYFEVVAYPLELCLKASTLSKDWREAMRIYLSGINDLQHLNPAAKLQERDIRMLKSNLKNLQGHNKWLLQGLKTGLIPINGIKIRECSDLLCDKNCCKELTLHDCMTILNSPCYNIEVKLLSVEKLSGKEFPSYLVPFIPIEEQFIQEFVLSKNELFLEFFWLSRINHGFTADIFRNKLLISNLDKAIHVQESIRLISFLEDHYNDVYELSQQIQTLKVPFIGPFGKILKFDHEITVKNSATRPVLIQYESEEGKKSLLYKQEDVRKDSHVVSLIQLMYSLCSEIFPENFLATYQVVPISSEAGFIEVVLSSCTLSDILSRGTISNYLYRAGSDKKISDVSRNYFASLAFWTVITYLLGVGDRHLDNIMIRNDGILFHIDYGFIFGSDSSASLIRIDDNLIEGLGGMGMYSEFKTKCCEIYCCLRQHFNLIYSCLLRLVNIKPPIKGYTFTYEFIDKFVSERFLAGETDEDACRMFAKMIDDSKGTFINKMSDAVHTAVSSFKTKWWSY